MNMAEWLKKNNAKEPWHSKRYQESHRWIEPYLHGAEMYDLGGESPFSAMIRQFAPDTRVNVTAFDLRYKFPIASETADLVTCMEVIEHVRDQNETTLADFTASGILNMLRETKRILKPGGHLFLTTPNVTSYRNIQLLMAQEHPYFFPPHHRELAPKDVAKYIRQAGLEIEHLETVNVWNNHKMPNALVKTIQSFLTATGHSLEHRNDCIFVMARKK